MARRKTMVTVGNIDRKPETIFPGPKDTVTVVSKGNSGFVEIEVRPDGRVTVRGWGRLVVHPEAANLIEVHEERIT